MNRYIGLLSLAAGLLGAQSTLKVVDRISIDPYGRTKTKAILVPANAILSLQPDEDSKGIATPALYCLADGHVIAKNDELAEMSTFECGTAKAQRITLLLISNSTQSAQYLVVLDEGSARSSNEVKPESTTLLTHVYFATDRRAVGIADHSPYFSSEPSADDSLTFGICEVSLPRDHRMGELEAPANALAPQGST